MKQSAPSEHAHAHSQDGRPGGLQQTNPTHNRLLAALSPSVYKRLLPHLKRRILRAGEILHEAGDPIESINFILSGVSFLRVCTGDGEYINIATVGNEGVIGIAGIMPANWPLFSAHVQIAGESMEIGPQALQAVLRRSRRFHDLLLDYTYRLSEQIGQGVACLRYHSNEERLARYILEIRERVASNPYRLTHAEIAATFGRSRSLISGGAKALRSKGLIDYSSGEIKVIDLEGLKAASCECYQAINQKILHEETFKP